MGLDLWPSALVGATQPIPPRDRELWRLTKGERSALAVERTYAEISDGRELRIAVDGELRGSCLYRGAGLEVDASEKRRALEQRGWIAATD